jgi:hypothetical protein
MLKENQVVVKFEFIYFLILPNFSASVFQWQLNLPQRR